MWGNLLVESRTVLLRSGKVGLDAILALELSVGELDFFLSPFFFLRNFVIFPFALSMTMPMTTMSMTMSMSSLLRLAVRVTARPMSMPMLLLLLILSMRVRVLSMGMRSLYRVIIAVVSNVVRPLHYVGVADRSMRMD